MELPRYNGVQILPTLRSPRPDPEPRSVPLGEPEHYQCPRHRRLSPALLHRAELTPRSEVGSSLGIGDSLLPLFLILMLGSLFIASGVCFYPFLKHTNHTGLPVSSKRSEIVNDLRTISD